MYREDEFYFITDRLHHDVYSVALREHLDKEERLVIKVFSNGTDKVVIETCNGIDTYIFDNRDDKSSSIYDLDLVFVKMMERYISSYEIENTYYESIEGVGSWLRVKIPGFDPLDKDLEIFYDKEVSESDISNLEVSDDIKNKLYEFLKITKGMKFSKPSKIKEMFDKIK